MENSINELLSHSCDNLMHKYYSPGQPKTKPWKNITPTSKYPMELIVALHLIIQLADRDHLTRSEELLLLDDLLEQVEILLQHCPEEQIILGRHIAGYLDPEDVKGTYTNHLSGNIIACLIFSSAIQECLIENMAQYDPCDNLKSFQEELFECIGCRVSKHHASCDQPSDINQQITDALWEFVKSITHIKIADLQEVSHLYRHHIDQLLTQHSKPLTISFISKKSSLDSDQVSLYLAYNLLYEQNLLKLMDPNDQTFCYALR